MFYCENLLCRHIFWFSVTTEIQLGWHFISKVVHREVLSICQPKAERLLGFPWIQGRPCIGCTNHLSAATRLSSNPTSGTTNKLKLIAVYGSDKKSSNLYGCDVGENCQICDCEFVTGKPFGISQKGFQRVQQNFHCFTTIVRDFLYSSSEHGTLKVELNEFLFKVSEMSSHSKVLNSWKLICRVEVQTRVD